MSFHHNRASHYGTALTVLSVAIASAFGANLAHAQSATSSTDNQQLAEPAKKVAAKKEQDKEASPVIVVTGNRGSLYRALNLKKDDDHIVDVISADNIGVMPNVSVAESLVRLPGINGARDRGNESLISARGLGQRLTLGLVNGREIASSEPGRAVRWEIFPTEVVSSAKVYKSQSADLVAGGIGATIDIGTVNPFEHTGKSVTVTGGPVYYTEGKGTPDYNPLGERFGASFIKRIDKNFGVALGLTYQMQKNASEAVGSKDYNISNADDVRGGSTPTPSPWGGFDEFNRGTEERKGALAAVEWRSGNFKVKADALYSQVGIDSRQSQTTFKDWFTGWGTNPYATPGSSYILSDGDVVGGTMNHYNKDIERTFGRWVEDKALTAFGVNLKWSADNWTLDSDLSSSRAWRDGTWRGITFKAAADSVSYNFLGKPTISTSPISFQTDAAGKVKMGDANDWGPDTVHDSIDGITLNATRQIDDSPFTSIAFGMRTANREKQHGHSEWKQATLNQPLLAYAGMMQEFFMPTFKVPSMVAGNLDEISRLAVGSWDPSLATQDPLATWTVKEKVREAYTKANYDTTLFGKVVTGNFGVRVVSVDTSSNGSDGVGGGWYDSGGGVWKQHPFVYSASSWKKSYTDVLPSATMNFKLDSDHILRFAAAKVMSRPPLDELRTGRTLDMPSGSTTYQLKGSGGNPDLNPFRASQLDMSYEWYFHKEALAAVTVYRKWVDSVIGYKQFHQTLDGHDYLLTAPVNGDGGNINGVELTFKTPLYFIPHMENFGINTNYSYVDSNLHELVPITNPLPLSGLARHTAEADFWYNDGKFEVGIGYKYHSPYSNAFGWDGSNLARVKSEGTVDVYAGWRVNDNVRLKLAANNLTNTPFRGYIGNQPNRLGNPNGQGGYQYYGRRISLEAIVTY